MKQPERKPREEPVGLMFGPFSLCLHCAVAIVTHLCSQDSSNANSGPVWLLYKLFFAYTDRFRNAGLVSSPVLLSVLHPSAEMPWHSAPLNSIHLLRPNSSFPLPGSLPLMPFSLLPTLAMYLYSTQFQAFFMSFT